jgi:prepilin-type N-terminal cleavage/methylation domain-containing protein
MARGNSVEKGFTLVELIVVLSFIGIMLVISVPAFRENILDSSLNSAARKTIGYINGLRELAARQRQAYYLYVDMLEHSLWFEKDTEKKENRREERGEKLVFPDGVRVLEIQTETSGKLSAGKKKMWISRRGYMEQVVLHLTDGNEKVVSLHFQPFLENVRIYEKYTPLP